MLTMFANSREVGKAFELGYGAYLYKPTHTDQLVGEVLRQIVRYQIEAASRALQHAPVLLLEYRHGPVLRRRRIRYSLVNIELLDEYIDENTWQAFVSLNAGETQKHTVTTVSRSTLTIEAEGAQTLRSGLSLQVPHLESLGYALQREVTSRLSKGVSSQTEIARSREHTYELPRDASDGSIPHVTMRRYERAPIRRRVRVSLLCQCDCCHMDNVVALTMSEVAGTHATRTIDTYSDGRVIVIETGMER